MKYINLLALLMLSLGFCACSEDEEFNGGNATVQFDTAEERISEATTKLNIPVVVSGDHTGLIKVRVEYKETHGLKDDENVIITSRELVFPAGVEKVMLETRLSVSNEEVEDGRVLTFEIVEVQGATLGANATHNVKLRESDPIEGTYKIVGLNPFDGTIGGMPCMLIKSDDVEGQLDMDFGYGTTIPVRMAAGDKEGDYALTIPAGNNAGSDSGYNFTFAYAILNGNSLDADVSTDIPAYFDGESQTITILPIQAYVGVGLYVPGAGWWDAYLAYNENGQVVPVQMQKQ